MAMLNNQMVLWAVVGNSDEMSWLLATLRKLILSGLSLFFLLKDLHFCEDWVILSLSGKHLSMMKMMVMVMMMMVMVMMVMMVVMVQMECGNLTPAPTRIHETPPPARTDLPRNESWTVDSNSWRRSWRASTPLDIPTMTTRRTRPEAVTLQGLPMDGQRGFASNIERCSCGSRTLKRVSHRHPWLHNHGPMVRKTPARRTRWCFSGFTSQVSWICRCKVWRKSCRNLTFRPPAGHLSPGGAAGSCLSLWSPIPPLIQLKMEHGPLNWLQDNQFADPILWIPCYMSGGVSWW